MKQFINKWIMRVKEARTVLTVGLWGVMATTQVLGFLRPYLVAWQMVVVAALMVAGGLVFTYLYDKLEFMKGEQMQRVKRKNNFVGEGMVLNHLGMIHFFSEAFDKDEEQLIESYQKFLDDYRRGVELNEL